MGLSSPVAIGSQGPAAKRVIVFRDGKIRKDEPVPNRPRAADVLNTLPTLED
jgi:hypothetical protein